MYYMTYGNNDYRDYVMAHSLGEWTKPVKYIAKKVVNGVTRYIYEPAKTTAGKISGSYYRKQADTAQRHYLNFSGRAKNAKTQQGRSGFKRAAEASRQEANTALNKYHNSLGYRAGKAREAIHRGLTKLKTNVRNVSGSLISRGRSLIDSIRRRIGKAYSDYKIKRDVKKVMKRGAANDKLTDEQKKDRATTARIKNNWNRAALGSEEAKKRAVKKSRKARAYTY